ncbi:MAG: phosphoribosylamine--glycine ligase, partial [Candidatus Dormibacteria bacterium]
TSKAFAKGVMDQAGVRTAPWAAFRDHAEALAHLRRRGAPVVVKADGLALGKGAFVCATEEEAEGVLEALMVRRSLGGAGATVVIEDCLEGEEISLFALTDGDRVVMLPPARDYKRAWVKDQGPNTGGMGAFAPAPESDWAGVNRRAREEVVEPVLREMRRRGTPFQGCLYVGGILTAQGLKVLEFNARFGDPEAEVLLPLLPDPVPLFWQTARGGLEPQDLGAPSGFCLGVVAVRRPYPEPIEGGGEISGLETAAELGCQVFQMGTRVGPSSRPEVSGGRVLICTATGGGLESARQLAYSGIEAVSFAGMSYRPDIGA